ncbi:glycosyltransferase family 2 protein [Pseudorhodobacter sp. W20_MBD10_FR17]|uniref:glycosyltransferase family 2 protein n=1 Tax=Pseudorhodobacter sp. W20_MBD10_FR17 TaxID=3240266 RepID=UPI003F9C3401
MKAFLVATAQNQGPYFLEWVAHHLEIGFTDIAIYQNDSDDLTHETLSALRDIGAIQYFYNRAPKPIRRLNAYARAAKLAAYRSSDWALALDMDEFLVVKAGGGTLRDLPAALLNADCIAIRRRNFGNSGYETITDQLVTERFSMADRPDENRVSKSLFRPAKYALPGIHSPQGAPHARHTAPNVCAQINHYATRDVAGFLLKSVQHPTSPAVGARYWATRNTNVAIDDSTRPHLARVAARMEALNTASNGRLMDLREAAIFAHMARYYTLLQDAPMRQLRSFCKTHAAAAKPAPKPSVTEPKPILSAPEAHRRKKPAQNTRENTGAKAIT